MKRIGIAFAWALLLSLLLGLCLSGLLWFLEWPWWYYPLALSTYTILWAWVDAKNLLARRLGNVNNDMGIRHQSRSIPISLDQGVAFAYSVPWPWGKDKEAITVDDGYTLYSNDTEVGSGLANKFIRMAHIRTDRGLPPFSRQYWLKNRRPTISRQEYDCIVDNLVYFELIVGDRKSVV